MTQSADLQPDLRPGYEQGEHQLHIGCTPDCKLSGEHPI